jgi:hypothetical protein
MAAIAGPRTELAPTCSSFRRDNRHERRRQRDQKRADTYADDSQRSCPLFGACPIDQPAAGHLAQKASEAADGQTSPISTCVHFWVVR